ncbi:class I SAM-dependent methyltransferase [Actinacidiphila glaucinigra]|uniref:class I SAM-dependent methyltransferase n=1 Tax=Actinacidiphila glaucinigra TaxID=235986 RepID=UPI002DDA2D84|nr:class I SAM-dependent methyltransferase [Actinacidiphila glaucinigra]WSD59449.1 class I SAM-dependent methyltransferase [Actinacidiphila glaucinigra]
MPFDHNNHYHRLLLRKVPPGALTALDVGCGTGRFARRLAARGLRVDAIDACPEAVAAAGTAPAPGVTFRTADVTGVDLPTAHYDLITCLASLHHMPFGTVTALRAALAPGGTLLVLGCYPERTPADWAVSLAAVPVNAAARLAVAAADRIRGREPEPVRAPVRPPGTPLPQIRAEAAQLLPGSRVRRLLFWRYLLVYRDGAAG